MNISSSDEHSTQHHSHSHNDFSQKCLVQLHQRLRTIGSEHPGTVTLGW